MNITWIGSPNFDTNRKPIDTVVIHWMDGTLSSTDKVFQDTVRDTSAHYGIEDEAIHQYVKKENVAYHAGVYAMNQRSIGIEHSADPQRPASELTYQTSAQLIANLCSQYKIPIDRHHIIKHSEVPYPTQCCGTIDIDRLVSMAKAAQGAPTMIIDWQKQYRDHIKTVYNDDFQDSWSDDEKNAFFARELAKAVDYKHRADIPPVQVGNAPRNAADALILTGSLLKQGALS